jgi:hypothetical protein
MQTGWASYLGGFSWSWGRVRGFKNIRRLPQIKRPEKMNQTIPIEIYM